MREFWLMVFAVWLAMVAGRYIKATEIEDGCKDFGAFRVFGTVYECRVKEVSK